MIRGTHLRGKTAFVGAATFGCGEAPGFTAIELAAEAARLAIADAGLTPAQIDGLFICLPSDFLSGLTIAEYLGIRPAMTNNSRTGGSAFLTHAEWAMLALDAGLIDYALICYGANQRTGAGKLVSAQMPSPFETPYRPNNPVASYALAASRHMYEYGTTSEQLASVAVAARQWANLNPEAFRQGPLTVEDVLATRLVADPLHVADCCLVTDGAAAVVMTRAPRCLASWMAKAATPPAPPWIRMVSPRLSCSEFSIAQIAVRPVSAIAAASTCDSAAGFLATTFAPTASFSQ